MIPGAPVHVRRFRHRRTIGYLADPLENQNEVLKARLANGLALIIQEANGRTCGTCAHYRGDWCAEIVTDKGDALMIVYPTAIACSSHEAG